MSSRLFVIASCMVFFLPYLLFSSVKWDTGQPSFPHLKIFLSSSTFIISILVYTLVPITTLLINTSISEVGWLTIYDLLHFYRECRLDWRLLGYQSLPVVKSFYRFFRLLCCLLLCLRKYKIVNFPLHLPVSLFLFQVHVFKFHIRLLCNVGQEHLVLLGYSNNWSRINLGVEFFISLLGAQSVLTKTVDGTLLSVNCNKWILVFGLIQDGLLDNTNS